MKRIALAFVSTLVLLTPAAMAKDVDCGECAKACDATVKNISKKGDKYTSLVRLMKDCSKVCKLSDDMHGSQFEKQVAALCADVCNKCASECESMKDKSLQNCIDQCRKCETSCKKMAS